MSDPTWWRQPATPEHAAAAALSAALIRVEPVRAQSARALYPLIAESSSGDGVAARRKAGPLSTLMQALIDSDLQCTDLALACEQWLMHPSADTGAALVVAAGSLETSPKEKELAWLCGAGIDVAMAEVALNGLRDASDAACSLIAAGCAQLIPRVWVARQLGVSRDALHRRIRATGADDWRHLLGAFASPCTT